MGEKGMKPRNSRVFSFFSMAPSSSSSSSSSPSPPRRRRCCFCFWRWSPCRKGRGGGAVADSHSSVAFLLWLALTSGLVGIVFFWLFLSSSRRTDPAGDGGRGCRPDGEGSWSIGVFYGKSPLALSPIELQQEDNNNANSSAWPVANPVLTCASPSAAGYPSNFVADPFLYVRDKILYLFFESKSSTTLKGDIGVARSIDQGATWEFMGIALQEAWHLSYPFVFSYQNQIYMMPEGNKKGELRLYRAQNFPLVWTFEKVLIRKPLIDASLVQYEGSFWLFASDFTRPGIEKNAELEIWYSNSPLGPWKQHPWNPIYRNGKSLGARNGGRPFIYEGALYRVGQDCGETYGRRIQIYKIKKLNKDEFEEIPVELGIIESKKGRNAWNGIRNHHLDAQQLPSGNWIAVMDGDRVPSGDSTWRFFLGCTFSVLLLSLVVLAGLLVGSVRCSFHPRCCMTSNRKSELPWTRAHPYFNLRARRHVADFNNFGSSIRSRLNPKTCLGKFVVCFLALLCLPLVCLSVHFLFGGNGAEEAYMFKGRRSQFTMITMTYEARLWNLKLYIKHYSRCESVRDIVVVWNKGNPPNLSEFDSAVPVRIRVEKHNSLNNRFKVDPFIKTRAVLELDDDIMMTCDDVEKGFRVWREHPERIVGFYPRLLDGNPPQYRNEKYARGKNIYNTILTGAAFMDWEFAFKRYWSNEAKEGRDFVDKSFNCEDLLMNFLYANSSTGRTVEYVHPAWAIDTSKLSTAAISRNTQVHYNVRTNCLAKFSALYGRLSQEWEFGSRPDRWDL